MVDLVTVVDVNGEQYTARTQYTVRTGGGEGHADPPAGWSKTFDVWFADDTVFEQNGGTDRAWINVYQTSAAQHGQMRPTDNGSPRSGKHRWPILASNLEVIDPATVPHVPGMTNRSSLADVHNPGGKVLACWARHNTYPMPGGGSQVGPSMSGGRIGYAPGKQDFPVPAHFRFRMCAPYRTLAVDGSGWIPGYKYAAPMLWANKVNGSRRWELDLQETSGSLVSRWKIAHHVNGKQVKWINQEDGVPELTPGAWHTVDVLVSNTECRYWVDGVMVFDPGPSWHPRQAGDASFKSAVVDMGRQLHHMTRGEHTPDNMDVWLLDYLQVWSP